MSDDTTGEVRPKISQNTIIGGMPIEEYHGQCCAGPSVSSSNLRDVELWSPQHMYDRWSYNPNYERPASKALAFGSAAHALILGDEAFASRHVLIPFADFTKTEEVDGILWKAKPAQSDDAAAVEAGEIRYKRQWRDALEAAGKILITQDQYATIEGMAEALAKHPIARDGVLQGEVEQSVFWRDEATGLWCKSRMDARPIGDTLADLKTIENAHPRKCEFSIRDHAYSQQFAFGAEGLLKVAEQRIYAHLIVFIEKKRPHAITPYEISPQAIWRAAQRNERARHIVADCLKRMDWPGYTMPAPYTPSSWEEERLQEEEDNHLLPPPPAWLGDLKEKAA